MQRIMNNPDDIVDEMLAGFVKCHSDIVKLVKPEKKIQEAL